MKTTLNKAIAILNMLIVSIFLDNCTPGVGSMIETTDSNFYQGFKGSNTHKKGVPVFKVDDLTLCPMCRGGSRYLYKLTNGEIVLLCEECEATWPSLRNMGWGGAVSDETLKAMFDVEDVEELFENSDWATMREANDSDWEELATVLVK